jgi:hypothetical protein
LSQWVNSDQWPSRIIWVGVILPASFVGGGTALLAFLNGSFADYRQQKKADDSGEVQTVQTKPASINRSVVNAPYAPGVAIAAQAVQMTADDLKLQAANLAAKSNQAAEAETQKEQNEK